MSYDESVESGDECWIYAPVFEAPDRTVGKLREYNGINLVDLFNNATIREQKGVMMNGIPLLESNFEDMQRHFFPKRVL